MKNDSVKNKIDRSVGIRSDIYKTKKLNLDQKLSILPRKLSPLRKKIKNNTLEIS